jgi:hypothetical protein
MHDNDNHGAHHHEAYHHGANSCTEAYTCTDTCAHTCTNTGSNSSSHTSTNTCTHSSTYSCTYSCTHSGTYTSTDTCTHSSTYSCPHSGTHTRDHDHQHHHDHHDHTPMRLAMCKISCVGRLLERCCRCTRNMSSRKGQSLESSIFVLARQFQSLLPEEQQQGDHSSNAFWCERDLVPGLRHTKFSHRLRRTPGHVSHEPQMGTQRALSKFVFWKNSINVDGKF